MRVLGRWVVGVIRWHREDNQGTRYNGVSKRGLNALIVKIVGPVGKSKKVKRGGGERVI